MKKIGLIAGNRKFPLLFAASARKKGCCIIAVAIKGDTSPKLKNLVDKIYWLKLADFPKIFNIFRAEGVNDVVMPARLTPAGYSAGKSIKAKS